MREAQNILLKLLRYGNQNNIPFEQRAIASIRDSLNLTEQEVFEVGEILQADFREKIASYPQSKYDEENQRLQGIVPAKFKQA